MTRLLLASTSGYVKGESATYATARDTPTSATVGTTLKIGQSKISTTYDCYESFVAFDTSAVRVAPAAVQLVLPNMIVSGSWTLQCATYDWGSSLTTGDYRTAAQLNALVPAGSVDASDALTPRTLRITLPASVLTLGGTTRLILYSLNHALGSAPTDVETVTYTNGSTTAFTNSKTTDPLLVLGSGADMLSVQVGFGSAPLSLTGPIFTDVTDDIVSVATSRGRGSETEQFQAGTATVVLRNDRATYDPDSNPEVLPRVIVAISVGDSTGTQHDLFQGWVNVVNGWQYNYTIGAGGVAATSTATMNCTDFFGILSTMELAAIEAATPDEDPVPIDPGILTGGMLVALVLGSLLPTAYQNWLIDAGYTMTSGYLGGKNALQFVQDLAVAEGGAFWITKSGVPRFEDRFAPVTAHATSLATFDDTGADVDIYQTGFTKEYATILYNSVKVTAKDRAEQSYEDATSIAAYGHSDLSFDIDIDGTEEAYARALYLVLQYKDPISAPAQLTLAARAGGTTLDAAVTLELRDRCIVKFSPPGT